MSETFLRCPEAFVSGGGEGGVGNVHSDVGPAEDSVVKGFDPPAAVGFGALVAGAGAAAGALLFNSFLPEYTSDTVFLNILFLPDKEGACGGSGRTPPPLPAPRGRCLGATEVAADSVVEDAW